MLERKRREQREADHNAERDHGKREKIAAPRPHMAADHQEGGCKKCGNYRAGRGQKQRREVADSNPGGR
jgi:hypothetical protein